MAISNYIVREDIYLYSSQRNIDQKIKTDTVGETSPNIDTIMRTCTQEVVNAMLRGGYNIDEILSLASTSFEPGYHPNADLRWLPLVKLICDMVILDIYQGQFAESNQIDMYRVMNKYVMMEIKAIQFGTASCLPSHWRSVNLSTITSSTQSIDWPSRYSRRPSSASRVRPQIERPTIEARDYTLSSEQNNIDLINSRNLEYRYELYEHRDGLQWLAKRLRFNSLSEPPTYSIATSNSATFADFAAVGLAIDTLSYLPLVKVLFPN